MVLLVPDDDDLFSDAAPAEKAQLDTEELREASLSGSDDKVELDLEDAPFLAEEEHEEEAPPPVAETVSLDTGEPAPEKRPLFKDKRVLLGGGVLLLLLIGIAAYLFWPKHEEAPPPPPEAAAPPKPAGPPPPVEIVVSWDPFWVEYTGTGGEIRFLVCKFSAPITVSVTDMIEKLAEEHPREQAEAAAPAMAQQYAEKFAWEIRNKKLVLRDAIFYYLRNKDVTFLSDKNSVGKLKQELLGVINQYLSADQLKDLLIEDYVVK